MVKESKYLDEIKVGLIFMVKNHNMGEDCGAGGGLRSPSAFLVGIMC